ncbi:MAG TPA: DEAD/DEAH box helicase [Azospirillaceae bacterium]|nr:DEAD/DEAH box helicase [Azospirillaceae bacterium]
MPDTLATSNAFQSSVLPSGGLLGRLPEGALAVVLGRAAGRLPDGLVFIARSEARAERLTAAAADAHPGLEVVLLPARDWLPGDRAPPSAGVLGRRAKALSALSEPVAPGGRLLVLAAEAAPEAQVPPVAWRSTVRRVAPGDPFDEADWRRWFAFAGYVLDERVDEPGEAAIRGAVLELFPGDAEHPYRIEIADGVVASIRRYDAASQRTLDEATVLRVHPVSELLASPDILKDLAGRLAHGSDAQAELEELLADGGRPRGMELLLSHAHERLVPLTAYMPGAPILFDRGAENRIADRLRLYAEEAGVEARSGNGAGSDGSGLMLDEGGWTAALAGREVHRIGGEEGAAPSTGAAPRALGLPARLRRALEIAGAGQRVVLALESPHARDEVLRRAQGLADAGRVKAVDGWPGPDGIAPGQVGMMVLRVASDFELDRIRVLAPGRAALAGAGARGRRPAVLPAEIATGDHVVHLDHGIGVVQGLETVETDGVPADVLVLEYAQGDRLLVPAADFDRIWRYGGEGAEVRLDRLKGGDAWAARRDALAAEIAVAARDLVRRAKARAKASAPTIEPPRDRMARFAARFGFTETEGQAEAIGAVLADLASGHPMDRLVCGDVGYGKTEVALRAAAAAAFAGYQVAVVAPTTVLARQHLEVFRRRFAGLGVTVEPLTASQSTTARARVAAGLADGSVQVVVGTHAVLGKGVAFQRLGLVVIDEEQRFGARQKQALRRLAQEGRAQGVHTLAMTATPIPRTLQSALVGLRDLSVIDTPPVRRRPVRTFIQPVEEAAVARALRRERSRGGQSFVVVPRIADLDGAASLVRRVLRGARIAVAHGRMKAADLDEAMVGFADGRFDVLVATPIIESGIDVPRANTILVMRPDLFGLAQLHQLRGRVGRGAAQGYGYLLTDPDIPLPERTAKRLGAIESIESLGGGFAIGLADMDQRGAGELTGTGQTGHVNLVGTELYQHLLAGALRRARGEPDPGPDPDVRMAVPQTIPPAYLAEEELRIGLHRRAARARTTEEVDDLAEEVSDRFGPPPQEVDWFLGIARLRCLCREAGLATLAVGPSGMAARPVTARAAPPPWREGEGRMLAPVEATDPDGTLAEAADKVRQLGKPPQGKRRNRPG